MHLEGTGLLSTLRTLFDASAITYTIFVCSFPSLRVDRVHHRRKQLQRRGPLHSVHQRRVPLHTRDHSDSIFLEESGFLGGRGDCIIVAVCLHNPVSFPTRFSPPCRSHDDHYSVHNAEVKSDCLFLRQWGFLSRAYNECR